MASAAFLIYSGIMPLIKTYIAIFLGYILARKGLFPLAASRGASQVAMNISLPALIFSNIVPAFTPQNVAALGPLFLIAFIYQTIGFLFGILIREVFYVPRNFWQGIVIVSGMSNWGNLPNAIVSSITQEPPFNPATDPALGVSFVAIFIVTYHLVFWVGGAAHSLSWDYLPGIPQGEDAEIRLSWKQKPIGSLITRYILQQTVPPLLKARETNREDIEPCTEKGKQKITIQVNVAAPPPVIIRDDAAQADPDIQLARHTSRLSVTTYRTARSPLVTPITPHPSSSFPPFPIPNSRAAPSIVAPIAEDDEGDSHHGASKYIPPKLYRILHPLSALFGPVAITLMISLPIALVQPLKALFVDVSQMGGPTWKGPDGRPPLAFIIDTAQFIGQVVTPLALIILGASFARLTLPRPLSRLPILAMVAVTLAKMLILPVIGVLTVQGMVQGGLIDRDARAEKFVAMFLSGTPAAVNQMIVSSLYAPGGDVDTLAAFLLMQYVFMFFSSSALSAVALLLS